MSNANIHRNSNESGIINLTGHSQIIWLATCHSPQTKERGECKNARENQRRKDVWKFIIQSMKGVFSEVLWNRQAAENTGGHQIKPLPSNPDSLSHKTAFSAISSAYNSVQPESNKASSQFILTSYNGSCNNSLEVTSTNSSGCCNH